MCNIRKTLIYSVAAWVCFATGEATDQLPIVHVRLGPPTNPQPQVAAEISNLEGARTDLETARMQELDLAYQHAVNHVSSALSEAIVSVLDTLPKEPTIRKPMSFLEFGKADIAAAQSFAVDVQSLHQPDVSIQAKLDQIEQTRSANEEHMFEQALNELAALESIFTSEVKAQVRAHAHREEAKRVVGFLQKRNDVAPLVSAETVPGLNVRLSASEQAFPTIESLTLAMEARRDGSEDVIRNRILELETQFFEVANNVLRDTLHVHVRGVA